MLFDELNKKVAAQKTTKVDSDRILSMVKRNLFATSTEEEEKLTMFENQILWTVRTKIIILKRKV